MNSKKSVVRKLEFQTSSDPDTGAKVTRLTPVDVTCHRNYFYQKCFTNDGRKLIFGAEFGPGSDWNYHMLDLQTGEAMQLTDGSDENTFGGFLSPDDRFLYFVRAKRSLVQVDVATLEEQVVYTVPNGWVGYGTWVANSACTKIVGIEIAEKDWFPLTDWTKFREMFFAKPRCRLIEIEISTGNRKTIYEEERWLGHPQYRPFDDATVAFCHEGNHDLVEARMWFINQDGSGLRCGKQQLSGESCTHEFWVPDGSKMIYVSYQKGQQERQIRSLDPTTLCDSVLTVMPPCSHLMSNFEGTLIVGDGCGSPVDVSDRSGYSISSDPYLHLFDLRTGDSRKLARHDSSWTVYKGDRQVTHPHPSFSPDERKVLFSCDKAGEPGLFLVDL